MKIHGRERRDFWNKVKRGAGCWEWQGAKNSGYGWFGGRYYAHRLAWVFRNGPVPRGLCVLHECDNRACVRPGHLYPGTQFQNVRDWLARGKPAQQAQLLKMDLPITFHPARSR